MDIKQDILIKSEALFMRYGIKSVTMDDISRDLGISKKTLYQYVDNKQDLIDQCFQRHIEEEMCIIGEIREEGSDSIDEILRIARYVIKSIRKVSPTVMYDLEKYYRKTYMKMKQLHNQHVYHFILENVVKGQKEGLYRAEIDASMITKIYIANTNPGTYLDLFPQDKYNLEPLVKEYTLYHLHGVVTPKGLELLEKYKKTSFDNID